MSAQYGVGTTRRCLRLADNCVTMQIDQKIEKYIDWTGDVYLSSPS